MMRFLYAQFFYIDYQLEWTLTCSSSLSLQTLKKSAEDSIFIGRNITLITWIATPEISQQNQRWPAKNKCEACLYLPVFETGTYHYKMPYFLKKKRGLELQPSLVEIYK